MGQWARTLNQIGHITVQRCIRVNHRKLSSYWDIKSEEKMKGERIELQRFAKKGTPMKICTTPR